MNRKELFVKGEPKTRKPYRYKECGLEDVYLMNGVTLTIEDNEEVVTIANIDGLHAAIGQLLVSQTKTVGPRELRFLRNEMNLSQAKLGRKLGVSDQSVARWEKGEIEIPGPADMLVRIIYLFETASPKLRDLMVKTLVEELDKRAKTDESPAKKMLFRAVADEWKPMPAVA